MSVLDFDNKRYLHILVFIGAFLFVSFLNIADISDGVRKFFGYYADPVAYWAGTRADSFNDFTLDLKDLPNLQKKYNDLLLQNSKLKAENAKYFELQDILKGYEKSTEVLEKKNTVLLGEVVLSSSGDNSAFLLVNLGRKDKVSKGDTVFWEDNFVGTISSTQNDVSRINLLYHEESVFKVRVFNENGDYAEGVVRGSSSGVKLENISNSFSLEEGQKVFVVDQKVSHHLVVGEVREVESDVTRATKSAMVTPFLNYRKLNCVFVIE